METHPRDVALLVDAIRGTERNSLIKGEQGNQDFGILSLDAFGELVIYSAFFIWYSKSNLLEGVLRNFLRAGL